MKKIFLLLALASVTLNLFAQSDFFYSKDGKKETFKIRKDIVIFKTKSTKDNTEKIWQHPKFKSVETINEDLMKAKVDPNDFDVEKLGDIKELDDAYYMLEYAGSGALQALCNQIFVRPSKEPIEKIIQKSGLSDKIEKQELFLPESGIYLLTLACKMKEILHVSRRIYETGMVDFAEPVFFREALLGNTLWQNQWNMKNIGQGNGTPGIDINVEPAWGITRGNSSIKIAIIDDGVDLTHPDLQTNLLAGVDLRGNSAGSYSGNDSHGTACAGVIGALNNAIGVVGVASGCKMIPIRAFINGYSSDTYCVSALNQARLLGADIINNSWGSDNGSTSATIEATINDCVNLGRNGKGCVVVFCSHNDDWAVRFPANMPNVIAVGSVTCVGKRVSDSNYGDALDVVAPVGGGMESINNTQVYTTDLQGASGEDPSDYRHNFNGTSAACPQVAGIAGLVLSTNTNLTALDVRNIISMTAKKLTGYEFTTTSAHPNGSWNNEVGYGLVDAHAAVQAATCTSSLSNQTVSSNKFVRSCSTTFTLQNVSVTSNAKLTVKADATSITGTLQVPSGSKFEFR